MNIDNRDYNYATMSVAVTTTTTAPHGTTRTLLDTMSSPSFRSVIDEFAPLTTTGGGVSCSSSKDDVITNTLKLRKQVVTPPIEKIKKVRFDDNAAIAYPPPPPVVEDDENDNTPLWYCIEDLEATTADEIRTIRMDQEYEQLYGSLPEDVEPLYQRGLESYLLPQEERAENKLVLKEYVETILEAQHEEPEDEEAKQDEMMAEYSVEVTEPYMEMALQFARDDEIQAKRIYLIDEINNRNTNKRIIEQ